MNRGKRFEKDWKTAGEYDSLTQELINQVWDSHNLCSCEDLHDTEKQNKSVMEVLDYNGIDYVVDTFSAPAFGINHRIHRPTTNQLRFDLRSATGTNAPAELETLRSSVDAMHIVPKYATRLKLSDDGFEWFKVVELRPLMKAINAGLQPHETWTNDDGTEAWLFDYDLLESMNIIYAKQT